MQNLVTTGTALSVPYIWNHSFVGTKTTSVIVVHLFEYIDLMIIISKYGNIQNVEMHGCPTLISVT